MRVTETWDHAGWKHAHLFLLFPWQLRRAAGLEGEYRARWDFGLAFMVSYCSRRSKIFICPWQFLQVLPSHGNNYKIFVSKSPKTVSRSAPKFSPGMQPTSGRWTAEVALGQPLALRDLALLLSLQLSGVWFILKYIKTKWYWPLRILMKPIT